MWGWGFGWFQIGIDVDSTVTVASLLLTLVPWAAPNSGVAWYRFLPQDLGRSVGPAPTDRPSLRPSLGPATEGVTERNGCLDLPKRPFCRCGSWLSSPRASRGDRRWRPAARQAILSRIWSTRASISAKIGACGAPYRLLEAASAAWMPTERPTRSGFSVAGPGSVTDGMQLRSWARPRNIP